MKKSELKQMIREEIQRIILSEDAKDIKRIQDMIKKSAGDEAKLNRLATTMSKLITNKDKAFRRGEAAERLLGNKSDVPIIFFNRAMELGYEDF